MKSFNSILWVMVGLISLLLPACEEPPPPGLAFVVGEKFEDGEWILTQEIDFQYSSSGRLERSSARVLDRSGVWFDARVQTSTYEASERGERLTTEVEVQRFSSRGSVREISTTYRYDAEGLVESLELVALSTAAPDVRGTTRYTYEDGHLSRADTQTGDLDPARDEWRYESDRAVEELSYVDGEAFSRVEWVYEEGKVVERRSSLYSMGKATLRAVVERDYSDTSFVEEYYTVQAEERTYLGRVVVSRDPDLGSITIESFGPEDLPVGRTRYDFSPEHTDNAFDVPWRPEPNEWERSMFYGPW